MTRSNLILLYVLSFFMTQCESDKKVVIAHRGASGYVPEHTLESKSMAHSMNADYIEQDLVLSKDNIPMVIHDIYLDQVTNVALLYPERKREDDRFYVIDFTYKELMTLSVQERFNHTTGKVVFPDRFPLGRSQFSLHSLQTEIELVQGLNKSRNKNIGIYPEIKNPGFHHKEGKDIAMIVLDVLNQYGYTSKTDNCILQCFDSKELRRVREELNCDLFLTQLMSFRHQTDQITDFASYADAIGPSLEQVMFSEKGKDIISKAHALNMKVHAYTFRTEELNGYSTFNELLESALYEFEIDGVFTDYPDQAVDLINQ